MLYVVGRVCLGFGIYGLLYNIVVIKFLRSLIIFERNNNNKLKYF